MLSESMKSFWLFARTHKLSRHPLKIVTQGPVDWALMFAVGNYGFYIKRKVR